jgi:hypothetical protein
VWLARRLPKVPAIRRRERVHSATEARHVVNEPGLRGWRDPGLFFCFSRISLFSKAFTIESAAGWCNIEITMQQKKPKSKVAEVSVKLFGIFSASWVGDQTIASVVIVWVLVVATAVVLKLLLVR